MVDVSEIMISPIKLDGIASTTTDGSTTDASTEATSSTTAVIPADILKEFPRLEKFAITGDHENIVFELNRTAPIDSVELIENDESSEPFVVPLKIILPITHAHPFTPANGSYMQYDYIVLKINDSAFHQHFSDDKPLHLFPLLNDSVTPTTESDDPFDSRNETSTLHADTSGENEFKRINGQNESIVFTDDEGIRYKVAEHHKILNDAGDIAFEFDEFRYDEQKEAILIPPNDEIKPESTERDSETRYDENTYDDSENHIHYSKMMQWIYFQL